MASEMINQVLQAEQAAADAESAAKNTAAELVKTAEEEAKATSEAEKAAAVAKAQEILAVAKKEADGIYAKARAKAASGQEDLVKLAAAKAEESVEAVIKHIIP